MLRICLNFQKSGWVYAYKRTDTYKNTCMRLTWWMGAEPPAARS